MTPRRPGLSEGTLPEGRRQLVLRHAPVRELAVTVVGIGIFLFFSVSAEHFTEGQNILNMLRVSALAVIIGIPLTFLLIVGEFDLSVGPNYALGAVLMALAASWGWNPWIAALFAITCSAGVGLVNAAVSVRIGVPSFITTLGTMSAAGGIAVSLTGGLPVVLPNEVINSTFAEVTGGTVGQVPVQVFWAVGILLLGAVVLRYSAFGAHVYATGGNPLASVRMGVEVRRVKTICFVLVGAACGLAGVITTGWLGSASAAGGQSNTLVFYSAIIIGGAAVTGGEGTAYGTLVGALIIGMLRNGLILLGVQSSWVEFFQGMLVIVAGASVLISRPDRGVVSRIQRGWSGILRRPPQDDTQTPEGLEGNRT